ncbi:MAG TPA: bifunctional DNA primase/helicase [Ignavibacteriaceae bacterium]
MYFDKLSDLGIKLTRRVGNEKVKCPQCSDGRKNKTDKPLSVNVTAGEYCCHNCGWKGNVRSFTAKREFKKFSKPSPEMLKNIQLKDNVVAFFANRAISKPTLDKFLIYVKEEWMPQTEKKENCICFPYFKDGELVNVKYRDGAKRFKMHKDAELVFFNMQSIGDKKHCIIVEGEIDCMAVYEAGIGGDKEADENGELKNEELSKWAIVSVPNGASKGNQKLEYLDNCAEWFIGLHEIVIATDGDEAGENLAQELIRRLGVERCQTVSYPIEEVVPTGDGNKRRCKDMNEVLQWLGADVLRRIVSEAQNIPVEGVYELDDIFPSMLENWRNGVPIAPTTRFPETDEYWRWKKGDIALFTGYANWGKTFYVLQMMLTKSIWDGWKWGVFCPENYPANDFYDDLVEMYVGKWLREMSETEYVDACHFIGQHIFYVYPEDSHDIHSIHEKFRYLVMKKGIDGVLVDPFNQLDHNQNHYQREDIYLSSVLKDIKRFALLNAISYNIVAHPKNPQYQEGKVLPVVDMYDIHGGSMFGNKVDLLISYHRPRFHEDKNSPQVEVYVQKVKRKRTGGKLGSFPLTLDWKKKRYCQDDGNMPCNPILAKMKGGVPQNLFSDRTTYLPYKDNDGDTVDF